jgi:hypothetical protein
LGKNEIRRSYWNFPRRVFNFSSYFFKKFVLFYRGSHDRPELLPIKAGICIMALGNNIILGAKEKYDIMPKIIAVGLNYYRPHRFRSKVVLEYGTP